MAKIVLGIAMSHSPQMSMPGTDWAAYAARDPNNPSLIFRRRNWAFDDLVSERAGEGITDYINEDEFVRKSDRIQDAVSTLKTALAEAKPDVVVVVGDDHHELYTEANMPTLAIFWGESVESIPPETIFPAIAPAAWALFGEKRETYPVNSDMARFLIEEANDAGFDVAQINKQREGVSIGHTFITVRTRLMEADSEPLPIVPVVMNTYFPPNRPTPARCYAFGKALGKAIASYGDDDLRVAVVASGGLSHFVVDEELDRSLLDAMAGKDDAAVAALDLDDFTSGTSESLCWLTAAGACVDLDMEVVDYVPAYRTPAGTGCAMGMVRWAAV